MKKQTILLSFNLVAIMITGLCQANSNELNACYKQENGQLRLLIDDSQCLPSELPVTLNGAQSPTCETPPNLQGTIWEFTSNKVSGGESFPNFQFGSTLKIEITNQEKNLFAALADFEGYPPQAPVYGAVIDCNQIRIATGQTVLFATLSSDGETMTGYWFSTDPLELVDGRWDLTRENPNFAILEGTNITPQPDSR